MSQTIKHILSQVDRDISHLLENIDNPTYAQKLPVFDGSSIGEHMRHIINFYECIASYLCKSDCSEINYAKRIRDINIEHDPKYALKHYQTLIQVIVASEKEWNSSVSIRILDQEDGAASTSTIGRELLYACEHAIHHLAIIIVGIRGANIDFELPKNFGVAPSTVDYKSSITL